MPAKMITLVLTPYPFLLSLSLFFSSTHSSDPLHGFMVQREHGFTHTHKRPHFPPIVDMIGILKFIGRNISFSNVDKCVSYIHNRNKIIIICVADMFMKGNCATGGLLSNPFSSFILSRERFLSLFLSRRLWLFNYRKAVSRPLFPLLAYSIYYLILPQSPPSSHPHSVSHSSA